MGEGGERWKQKFWYKEVVFPGGLLHITPCQSLIIRASFGPPIGRGPKDPLCLSVWLDVGGWHSGKIRPANSLFFMPEVGGELVRSKA